MEVELPLANILMEIFSECSSRKIKPHRMDKANRFLLLLLLAVPPLTLCESLSLHDSQPSWKDIQPEDGFHASAKDIYILSQSNFTNCVLRSRDPWVVIPLAGGGVDNWKRLAESLRGVAFFGTIDLDREVTLLSELNFHLQSSVESGAPLARVYPYGKANIKMREYQDMSDEADIEATILQSLPSTTITSVANDEDLNDFLMNCLLYSPTKFAVLFILDTELPVPGTLLTISHRLQRYFSFGTLDTALARPVLRNVDTQNILREQDMSKPGLVVVKAHLQKGSISYKASFYPETVSDTLTYFSVFKFLFQINSNHREYLPGHSMAEDEEVTLMEDAIEAEWKRFRFVTKRSRSEHGISAKNTGHSELNTEL